MPETPDFDQIAERFLDEYIDDRTIRRDPVLAAFVEQLRLIWHAGFEAGGQHETFVQHLKDENTAAHLALDRLDAPKTTQVPRRDGIGKQDITIGLAERIEAARRLIWNARGAADLHALATEVRRTWLFLDLEPTIKALDR